MPYPKFNSIFKDSFLEFFTTMLGDISIDLADGRSLLLPYKPPFFMEQNGDVQPYFILDKSGEVIDKGNSNCVAINLLVKYPNDKYATPEDLLKYTTLFIEEKLNNGKEKV
jgi:hypothetical protein